MIKRIISTAFLISIFTCSVWAQVAMGKWRTHPNDFQMFFDLRNKGRQLISSIPGYATHGETKWLAPLTNWETQL